MLKSNFSGFIGYNYTLSNFFEHVGDNITLKKSKIECIKKIFGEDRGYIDPSVISRRINGKLPWPYEDKKAISDHGYKSFLDLLKKKESEALNYDAKLKKLKEDFKNGNVNIDEKFKLQQEAENAKNIDTLLEKLLSIVKNHEEHAIKCYAFGLYAVLWYFVTNGTECLNLPSDLDGKESMMQSEFFEKLKTCLAEVEIITFLVSENENELSDIYFKDDRLIINRNVETPYFIWDIESIKFYNGQPYEEENAVLINFKNGERLDLLEWGDYDAWFSRFSSFKSHNSEDKMFREYELKVKAQKQGVDKDKFVIVDSCLIQYNGTDKELILPEGIVCIESGIFENAPIEKIVMPSSLKTIGDYSFRNCKQLKSVILNDGLETIANRAFCACEGLSNILLPQSLKSIEPFAFLHTGIKSFDTKPSSCEISDDVFG